MLFDGGCVVCGVVPGPVCERCVELLLPAPAMLIDGLAACRPAYILDDRSRTIIAAFKYRRQRRLARWLAGRIADRVPRGADVLTWMPATPARRRSRGFDQAEELARSVGKLTGVPAVRLLKRDRKDRRQTGRTRTERAAGPALEIVGRSPDFVVIIDDVITTGSSMTVAADALRAGGATRVVAASVAATPLQRDTCLHLVENGSRIPGWT